MKLLGLALLAAGLVAVIAVSGGSPSIGGVVRVTAIVTEEHEHGGRTIAVKQIRSPKGQIIGWGDTVCWDLGNGSSQCLGTFVLPLGKLNVAGTRRNQTYFVFAIVGGTGIYSGAGGVLIGNTFRVPPRFERLNFFLDG